MIKLIDLLNEIKINQPLSFPTNEDWVYVVKNEEELNKILKILESRGWIWISKAEFDETAYPIFIEGYIDKTNKQKFRTTFMFNRHFGKILNPQSLPAEYLEEIKINNPKNNRERLLSLIDKLADYVTYQNNPTLLQKFSFQFNDTFGKDELFFNWVKTASDKDLNNLYQKLKSVVDKHETK